MTPEEAITILKIAKTEVEWDYPLDYAIAIDTAIEALEKQIPKKPITTKDGYKGSYGICPNCKNIIDEWNDYCFCNECGQAIDWSVEE